MRITFPADSVNTKAEIPPFLLNFAPFPRKFVMLRRPSAYEASVRALRSDEDANASLPCPFLCSNAPAKAKSSFCPGFYAVRCKETFPDPLYGAKEKQPMKPFPSPQNVPKTTAESNKQKSERLQRILFRGQKPVKDKARGIEKSPARICAGPKKVLSPNAARSVRTKSHQALHSVGRFLFYQNKKRPQNLRADPVCERRGARQGRTPGAPEIGQAFINSEMTSRILS